jgi:hypothetical protein
MFLDQIRPPLFSAHRASWARLGRVGSGHDASRSWAIISRSRENCSRATQRFRRFCFTRRRWQIDAPPFVKVTIPEPARLPMDGYRG